MRSLAALLAATVIVVPLPAQQRRVVARHYTYVIVHGAWGGGWDWLAVDSMLTFTDTLRLVNPARLKVPAAYILTYEPQITPDPFQMFADRAAARGWPVYKMVSDHLPERTHRTELVALLEKVP